jgi:hypothetical protein
MSSTKKSLDQLDEVDWKSLRTAHGTAERIPRALRWLFDAKDETSLAKAYWSLDNYMVLQGTIYESAYYAIPYIVHILIETKSSIQKSAAYDLLIEIARGVPDPNRLWSPPPDAPNDLRDACRNLIASSLREFQSDLQSPDESIQLRARDLFSSFGSSAGNRIALN